MRRVSLYLLAVAVLTGCSARRVPAQDLGNVGLRTVIATVATSTACNGVAQNFDTSNTTLNAAGYRNIGQTQHFMTVTASSSTQLTAEIDGIDSANNITRISDVIAGVGGNPTSVTGYGQYANIRLSVTCTSGTFSLTYSGAFTSFGNPSGGYQVGQADKAMFLGSAANTTQTINFQTPFGSSGGSINFLYNTAGVGGSSIQIICGSALLSTFNATYFLANTTAGIQVFDVPSYTCTKMTVQYVSGGATAGTITAEYLFAPPGTRQTGPAADGFVVCQPAGNFTACSPSFLGVNGLTEPGSSTSTLSSIIDTRGAKEATLHYTCTQGPITLNVQTYAEDGTPVLAPTALALVSPVSAVAAATNAMLHLGSEANPTVNTGTLSGTAILRLPQRALAFSFTNGSASAGTCTARLFLTY